MMAEGGLEGMDAGKGEGRQGREQSLWGGREEDEDDPVAGWQEGER